MAILRAMDGKFYDVPDEQAAKFEVPRDKVKELLEKSGMPAQQGAPGPGQGGQRGAPPPGGPPAGSPVVVHIHTAGTPHIQSGPPPAGQGAPAAGQPPSGDAEVDPYWWIWRNYWPNWGNYWPNY